MLDDEDSQVYAKQKETNSAEKDPQSLIAPNTAAQTSQGAMMIDTTDARETASAIVAEESKVRNDSQEESKDEQ